jgi:xylulose-5-phosphate/fructose-6-phosphate phosphoketolase
LFTDDGDVLEDIKRLIPEPSKVLGQRQVAHEGYSPLKPVKWADLAVQKGSQESPMKSIGILLDKYLVANPRTLRIFSPDELVSNKLDAVFEHTGRNFQWDQYSRAQGGRVIETLSEHQCQGFLQGYTLTGRVGIFPSYESFLGIIHTMMVQYSKFNKMVRLWSVSWSTD